MAREKMFDPAFQKSFTEAINKEKKIRSSNYVDDVSGFPRTARVDFQAEVESDESDIEEQEDYKKNARLTSDNAGKLGLEYARKSTVPRTKSSDNTDNSHNIKSRSSVGGKYEMETQAENHKGAYIFPICNICDFGWEYASRKYVICPYHGPFRLGYSGYGQPTREYLEDQIRREAMKDKEEKKNELIFSKFYL